MSKIGDNSIDAGHLRAFVERIERMEEEKKTIADDIKEIYQEAQGSGYSTKILRKIVALRRKGEDARKEEAEMMRIYAKALQMDLLL